MSEDEIIKNLNDLLEHNYLEDVGYLREENDYVVYNNAIQGLLDLYKQEKERRKIAESKNAKVTLVLSNVLNELYNDTIPGAKTLKIKKLTED